MPEYSAVLIVPETLRADANALGSALGYGPETYTVPLSADGQTVTHWGAHAWVQPAFVAVVIDAAGGALPPVDWSTHGLTEVRVARVLAALVISVPGSTLDALQFVDINTASPPRLQVLPGVGPALSAAIVDGRPWGALSDLTAISGIGPATVAAWAGLALTGPRPIPEPGAHFRAVIAAQSLTTI